MTGMFDDLIPQKQGMFDDLIPKGVKGQPGNPGTLGGPDVGAKEPGNEAGRINSLLNNPQTSAVNSFVAGGGEGLTINAMSDILAAGDAIRAKLFEGDKRDFSELFSEKNKARIAEIESFQKANPKAFLAGEIGGAIASVGAPGGAAIKGGTLAAKSVKAAGAGAAAGGVAGFNEGADLEDRIDKATKGVLMGGATGGVAPGLGRQVGKLYNAVFGKKVKVPTAKTLRKRAKVLYTRAEKSGVRIAPSSTENLVRKLAIKAQDEGAAKGLTDETLSALRNISERQGKEMSIKEVETLRKMLLNATTTNNSSNNRIAHELVDVFDGWTEGLGVRDVLSNSKFSGKAFKTLKSARSLWRQQAKAEIIEEAFEKARNAAGANFTQSGFETAIRQKFRAIADNKKTFKRFNKEEQAAILDVVRGNRARNLARLFGKLAPTGPVSALSSIAATGIGGPAVGAATALTGAAGRVAATKGGLRAANKARDQILRGKPLPRQSTELAERTITTGGLSLVP